MWDGLASLAEMPAWLADLRDPTTLRAALAGTVPGLQRVRLRGIRLKDTSWTGRLTLTVRDADGRERDEDAVASIVPPDGDEPESAGARVELLTAPDAGASLPSFDLLIDPERARPLLEEAVRTSAPELRDFEIVRCEPEIARYSPGSRCTVVYRLDLPRDAAGDWPRGLVAKTYHRPVKGRTAWDGMRELWRSPLATSTRVEIAEPIAWMPELSVLVQRALPHQRTLVDLLAATLIDGDNDTELHRCLAATGAGLAELHHCGAPAADHLEWHDELAEVHQVVGRLTARVPRLRGAVDPLIRDLEVLEASIPADPAGPAHRSFRPAQVLLDDGAVGFIDFDGFCHAEPALDLALFCTTLRERGLRILASAPRGEATVSKDRQARLDGLCATFLSAYEALAPVSRGRVALWEAVDLLTNVLHAWTKAKPDRLPVAIELLREHTRGLAASS